MPNQNKTILVVEDDDMLRTLLMEQIVNKYIAVPAKDGQEAIDQITQKQPDLIILDLLLPKVDGFQVLETLRAMPDPKVAATPVIIVSNLSDDASIEKAQSYKIEAYFTKSDVTLGSLIHRIERVLNKEPGVNVNLITG